MKYWLWMKTERGYAWRLGYHHRVVLSHHERKIWKHTEKFLIQTGIGVLADSGVLGSI